ncbi:hypothetical protein DW687_07880 [Anaerofustis stercorihominis]|uniref:Uncharacterized protein n=2 Tax=Anaerofustis stercorihominis TaxID=214853 RepID=A0A3E3DZF7_9FIRM|nr:hypothetical protein DW687_07880 [Anaerofustis stercorihominis]
MFLWGKCKYRFSNNNEEEIMVIIYKLKNYIKKNIHHKKSLKQLENIYTLLSGSKDFAKMHTIISFNSTLNDYKQIYIDINNNSSIKQEWKMYLKSILLYKSGYHDESLKNSIKLYYDTKNKYIKKYLSIIFRLDILMFTNIIFNQKEIESKKMFNIYINSWNNVYKNFKNTLNMFDKLEVLKINGFDKNELNKCELFDYNFFTYINNIINSKNIRKNIIEMTKFLYDLNFSYDRNN